MVKCTPIYSRVKVVHEDLAKSYSIVDSQWNIVEDRQATGGPRMITRHARSIGKVKIII